MTKKTAATAQSVYTVYCVCLYALWSVRELLLRPVMEHAFGAWANAWLGAAIKLLVWTVPAVLLIRRYEGDLHVSLREMYSTKVKWLRYLLIAAGFLLYLSSIALFSFGHIGINPGFRPASFIGTVLVVGITEETVFRGWLLNVELKTRKPHEAILRNAGLFLLIHFPIWISRGMIASPFMAVTNCLGIFVLGVLFAWTFLKSRNIFVPIALHMTWNFINTALFGY